MGHYSTVLDITEKKIVFIPHHTIRVGYHGFTLGICVSVLLPVCLSVWMDRCILVCLKIMDKCVF